MRGLSLDERAQKTLLHLHFTRFALFRKTQKREDHHASNTTSFTSNDPYAVILSQQVGSILIGVCTGMWLDSKIGTTPLFSALSVHWS